MLTRADFIALLKGTGPTGRMLRTTDAGAVSRFTVKAHAELDAWAETPDDGAIKDGNEWTALFVEFGFARTNLASEGRSRYTARRKR